ncbi:MAG: magnesium transporter, partial [Actinomycetales bacterium]
MAEVLRRGRPRLHAALQPGDERADLTDRRARVLGLVVEVLGRRRVFLPITRVTSLDGGQIITT